MDSYTITIAPNDDSGAATRLVVDTSGEQIRITDVHLHAPHGLSSGHIPTVDFDLLLRAVTGTTSPGHSSTGTTALSAPHDTPALEATAAQQPVPATAPRSRTRNTKQAAATPTPRPRRATAATKDESPAPRRTTTAKAGTGERAPAKPAPKPAPAKKRTPTRTTAPAPSKRARTATTTAGSARGERVYRRTPDDLAAVLAEVGTVVGVAEHYQVPRYTAQGWISRLRATT